MSRYGALSALSVLLSAGAAAGSGVPTFALPRVLSGPGPVYDTIDAGQLRTESRGPSESVVLVHASADLLTVLRAGSAAEASDLSAQFHAGTGPRFIAMDDMDNDGDKDFVLTYTSIDRVRILWNRAETTGGVELGPVYVVGTAPAGVAVGDFNGDGTPDIVAANTMDHTIRVVLSNAEGGWTVQPTAVQTAWSPWAIRTADFDGDGALDLMLTGINNDAIAVHLGDGTGGFGPARLTPVGDRPTELVLGDFDGDGDTDAACTEQGWGTVRILLNDGGGVISAGASMYAGSTPGSLRTGDLNADGLTDIAVAVPGVVGEIVLYINDGDGGFDVTRIGVPVRPGRIELADLTGDQIEDLLVTDQSGGLIVQYDNLTEPPVNSGPCPGDTNDDRVVDTADLLVLLANFGRTSGGPAQGEFTGDFVVLTDDLLLLLSAFGQVCN